MADITTLEEFRRLDALKRRPDVDGDDAFVAQVFFCTAQENEDEGADPYAPQCGHFVSYGGARPRPKCADHPNKPMTRGSIYKVGGKLYKYFG